MASLPIEPTIATREEIEYNVLVSQLGDNYSQRAANGINTVKEIYTLEYTFLDSTNALVLINFFDGLKGIDNFTWTIPFLGTTKKFIAKKRSITYLGNNCCSLSVQIEEVFDRS